MKFDELPNHASSPTIFFADPNIPIGGNQGGSLMSRKLGWAKVDLKKYPHIVSAEMSGPKSSKIHGQYFKGLSSQAKLFSAVFESGCGLSDKSSGLRI